MKRIDTLKKNYLLFCSGKETVTRRGGGGLVLVLYVPPRRVRFLRRFGLKVGIDFAHFGLESGMVFEETTGVYERSYRFNPK